MSDNTTININHSFVLRASVDDDFKKKLEKYLIHAMSSSLREFVRHANYSSDAIEKESTAIFSQPVHAARSQERNLARAVKLPAKSKPRRFSANEKKIIHDAFTYHNVRRGKEVTRWLAEQQRNGMFKDRTVRSIQTVMLKFRRDEEAALKVANDISVAKELVNMGIRN